MGSTNDVDWLRVFFYLERRVWGFVVMGSPAIRYYGEAWQNFLANAFTVAAAIGAILEWTQRWLFVEI